MDDLVHALPGRGEDPRSGLVFDPDGTVTVTPAFRALEAAWYEGLACMARRGASVILDEVFLDGGSGQARLRAAFDGLDVLWVGVRCDPVVATAREADRPDRVPGMATRQALAVHDGVAYDVEVDTTDARRRVVRRARSPHASLPERPLRSAWRRRPQRRHPLARHLETRHGAGDADVERGQRAVLGDGGDRVAALADQRRQPLLLAPHHQGHRALAEGQVVERLRGLSGQPDRPHTECRAGR